MGNTGPMDVNTDTGSTSGGSSGSPIPDWVWNPAKKIRGIIYGDAVKAIISAASTLIGGILLFARGDSIGLNTGENAVWGIEDVVLYFVGSALDLLLWIPSAYFEFLIDVNTSLVPANPSPITGLALWVVLGIEIIVTVAVLIRLIPAAVSAIPVAGPALKTLLFGG